MDGGSVNISDWSTLVALAGSPLAMVVLTFFVWKMTGEIRELKTAHKELNDTIHNNGFLKRADMQEAWRVADEIHERHDHDIARLEAEIVRLRERHG